MLLYIEDTKIGYNPEYLMVIKDNFLTNLLKTCYDSSTEPPHRGDSDEKSQHVFKKK